MSDKQGQEDTTLTGLSIALAKLCEAQRQRACRRADHDLIDNLIKNTLGCDNSIADAVVNRRTTDTDKSERHTNGGPTRGPVKTSSLTGFADQDLQAPSAALGAGTRLVGTFELLEQILMDGAIDMQTVLLAQRVNKTFVATVANSLPLQRKLFFTPQPHKSDVPTLNRLLTVSSVLSHLPFWAGSDNQGKQGLETRAHLATDHHVVLEVPKLRPIRDGERQDHFLQIGLCARRLRGKLNVGVLELGSWQRMYMTQPPCIVVLRAYSVPGHGISMRWGEELRGWRVIKEPGPLKTLLRSAKYLQYGNKQLFTEEQFIDSVHSAFVPG
ncbi:hypothetical protein LTR49_024912 [Elasticomyces elasticus]|nr:hypothetical protein LTR49_024912 [Elasticomyces elasticus]